VKPWFSRGTSNGGKAPPTCQSGRRFCQAGASVVVSIVSVPLSTFVLPFFRNRSQIESRAEIFGRCLGNLRLNQLGAGVLTQPDLG
jgi:hypothetical protein